MSASTAESDITSMRILVIEGNDIAEWGRRDAGTRSRFKNEASSGNPHAGYSDIMGRIDVSEPARTQITEAWKQWEGHVVNGEFCLNQYLGGDENSAVFLTEHGEQGLQAAIKLLAAPQENAELQLSRWELAAKLSHPHLVQLFQMGRCQLGDTGLLYVVMEYAEENLSQIV